MSWADMDRPPKSRQDDAYRRADRAVERIPGIFDRVRITLMAARLIRAAEKRGRRGRR